MDEIDNSQFSKVNPLLQGVSTYLSLSAIIKGRSSGRIWVNDPLNPGIAFVWDLVNGFLFVLGRSTVYSSEMNLFLKERLLPLAKKSGYTNMYVIILSAFTDEQLNHLFEGLSFKTGNIHHFRLHKNTIDELTIPPAFQLVRIDGKILESKKITNIKEVKRCITACWRNLENYFQEGIGYALLTNDTVVSWCSTDYVVLSKCELYVETFTPYERKGFGTAVTLACVRECLNQNYEVNWHCWHGNTGSIRIAEKIGFLQEGILEVQIVTL